MAGCGRPGPVTGKVPPPNVEVTTHRLPDPNAFHDIVIACQGQRVPVIMYHDVIERRGRGSVFFDVTAADFQTQMEWIQAQGAVPISLQDLYDHLTTGKAVPDKAIVLTFDDNYQGYYDYALPILRKFKYPSAMFVHTGYVGDTKHGRPKMTWAELKELSADPLVTIGSHTVTHPADITKLTPDEMDHELVDSKAELEKQLGKPVPFLAYPDGNNNQTVQDLSKAVGYKMAFSIHNQLAEESPNIMCVGRYISTRLEKAWADRDRALQGGVLAVYEHPLTDGPVSFSEGIFAGEHLALVTGGSPVSLMSDTREGVLDFIRRTPGAVAGINGGFFAMAAINSTDNRMVGPCKTSEQPIVVVDTDRTRWQKLRDRPMVMWSPTKFAIAPYIPEQTVDADQFLTFMPDVTDVFLAGVWLVHDGVARTAEQMATFASKDIIDPRRRAFIGQLPNGEIVIGASKDSATSEQLAQAVAAAGVSEAVLLDSGFSTSLVYGEKIMASGHSTADKPSRPVPHAIVLKGILDPASAAVAAAAIPATDPLVVERVSRHHHRVRPIETAPSVAEPNPALPDASGPTSAPVLDDPFANKTPNTGDPDKPPVKTPPDTVPPVKTPPDKSPPNNPPPPDKNPPKTTGGGTTAGGPSTSGGKTGR
jgi:biofilm PGA synthesis lipoprotein PgaB